MLVKPIVTAAAIAITETEVLEICQDPQRNCLYSNGRFDVVHARQYAIKFGRVSTEEIWNQQHAHLLLDPAIVRVPRIHLHFTKDGVDYVVMDYVNGEKRDSIQDATEIRAVAKIVNHLHTFTSDIPGPVNMGTYAGPLWSEDDLVSLPTKQSLEAYVNARLRRNSGQFVLDKTPLVFVHCDIAARNLLFAESGIWLLDWEFAGYFPRSAEIATFRHDVAKDFRFYCELERAVLAESPLSIHESAQIQCWQELTLNHVSIYRPSQEEKRAMYKPRRNLDGHIVRTLGSPV